MTKGFPLLFVIREAARIGHLGPKLHRPIPISISPELRLPEQIRHQMMTMKGAKVLVLNNFFLLLIFINIFV
jgi:hypothetical protein